MRRAGFCVAFILLMFPLLMLIEPVSLTNWRIWAVGGIAGLFNLLGYIEGRMQQ